MGTRRRRHGRRWSQSPRSALMSQARQRAPHLCPRLMSQTGPAEQSDRNGPKVFRPGRGTGEAWLLDGRCRRLVPITAHRCDWSPSSCSDGVDSDASRAQSRQRQNRGDQDHRHNSNRYQYTRRSSTQTRRACQVHFRIDGCCWVAQWMPPPPAARASMLICTTSWSGNNPSRTFRAAASALASPNWGAMTPPLHT